MAKVPYGILAAPSSGGVGYGAYVSKWKNLTRLTAITSASNPRTAVQQDNRYDFKRCVRVMASYQKRFRDKFLAGHCRPYGAYLWLIAKNFKYFHSYPHLQYVKLSNGSTGAPISMRAYKHGPSECFIEVQLHPSPWALDGATYCCVAAYCVGQDSLLFWPFSWPVEPDQEFAVQFDPALYEKDWYAYAFYYRQTLKHVLTAVFECRGVAVESPP